ncbi:MAG: apolipoprotein N-acyltransferase [Campylobacteraceae bacterium]|nr:apolipoprotein N-acyltransferase [Campylobacteraceae bacterium]
MKLKNFPLAYKSFNEKNLSRYFITFIIIKAFVTAVCLSAFIYLAFFDITNYAIHSFFALAGFWLLLKSGKLGYFLTGFFIGIFWFYWISFSFRYYGELYWMMPIVILLIAIIYGGLFLIPALITESPYLKAFLLLLFSQIAPFGFNWFNFELILHYTPFGLTPLHVGFLMTALLTFRSKIKGLKIIALCLLIASIDFSNNSLLEEPNIDIELAHTKISQNDKWENENIIKSVKNNFDMIEKAIKNKKRLIILPETAFALYLNKNEVIVEKLLKYSEDIAIIAGGLAYENDKYYNSAYFFDKGEMKRADKVTLVPFAEKIPLPNFLVSIINDIFFDGADDFTEASNPTDFMIDNIKIRSAVCFEGSSKAIYKNEPKYISVISNNAWFLPSTEPILQNLMLSLYATKTNSLIYHSINGSESVIIKPRPSLTNYILKNTGIDISFGRQF